MMSNGDIKTPWNFRDFTKVIIANVVLVFAFGWLLEGILGEAPKKGTVGLTAAILALQWAAMLLPMLWFTVKKYGATRKDFAFKRMKPLKVVLEALRGYGLFIFFAIAMTFIIMNTGIDIPGFSPQQEHLSYFGEGALSMFVAFLFMAILAPIVEEIFFRGFVLQTLLARFGKNYGNWLSAIFFAAIHFEFQSFLGLLVVGLILNHIFLRNRSLWPCIAFHVLNNSIALAAEYWLRPYLESGGI